MTSKRSIPCAFFARGFCRSGSSCNFMHDQSQSLQKDLADSQSLRYDLSRHKEAAHKICPYFLRGSCKFGNRCQKLHDLNLASHSQEEVLDTELTRSGDQSKGHPVPIDPRSLIPCKFASLPEGCRNSSCLFLHLSATADVGSCEEVQGIENEEDGDDDLMSMRQIIGASVRFNEFGHIVEVSFPYDYSCARITGLTIGSTSSSVVDVLDGLDFKVDTDCIRMLGHSSVTLTSATVKVKDPHFAKALCAYLSKEQSSLHAEVIPVSSKQANWKKVRISWHRATRSAWLNFGNEAIAERVASKFNNGTYRCLGHLIKCSAPTTGRSRISYSRFGHNPVPWTIVLQNLPGCANQKTVEISISDPFDRPRHIEMSSVSYKGSTAEVSMVVRSRLETYGPLESFFLVPTSEGKRVKAVARYQDEVDATSASALNNTTIDVLGEIKLYVALIRSAKVKVSTEILAVSRSVIENQIDTWKQRHLKVHLYEDICRHLTTIKIEGDDPKEVSSACRTLSDLTSGVVLEHQGDVLWGPSLSRVGIASQKLKMIAGELKVVIIREKLKQQLRFHGPNEKLQQAILHVREMLSEELNIKQNIDLGPKQFSWALRGGFKIIQQSFGEGIAIMDVVGKKIIIDGTAEQFQKAMAMVKTGLCIQEQPILDLHPKADKECPICFCDAEVPVQTSCKHQYCLSCFEDFCKSSASSSQKDFQVMCCGSGGTCATIFTLKELQTHLPSSTFEGVLQKSFEEHVTRHPNDLRFCPIPDCGYVYRSLDSGDPRAKTYTCPNCFEQFCVACHVQHGTYTCADYKDIAAGGGEALEKLKRELSIKDCPRCKTLMEKTEGCNHMTCAGCKAHICWVCMAVFDQSGLCYDHMTKEHGGCYGADLNRFIY